MAVAVWTSGGVAVGAAPVEIGSYVYIPDGGSSGNEPVVDINNDDLDFSFSSPSIVFCDGSVRTFGDGSVRPEDGFVDFRGLGQFCDGSVTPVPFSDTLGPGDALQFPVTPPPPTAANDTIWLFIEFTLMRAGLPVPGGTVLLSGPISTACASLADCTQFIAYDPELVVPAVPEPGTLTLLAGGLGSLILRTRRTWNPRRSQ
jgi:hypothetical protein